MFLHKNKLSSDTHIQRDFLFGNDSKVMYSLLNEIISFVKIHFPSDTYEDKLINCKQALIELLTNGVKHSKTDASVITVILKDHKIELIKSDKGRAIIQNENRIAFELDEFPIENVSIESNLIEHYGLMILTKVSDQFYYVHDASTHTNLFHVVINID